MKAIRWSGEGDRYFGPLTYAKDRYRNLALVLGSGDGDDYPGCRLRISAFGHTLIAALPAIIRPWRKWVDTSKYEWSKGGGGYWETGEREYGFTLSDGHLSVALGRVTNDSRTEQCWGCFLPWTQWRHVRRSFYNPDGSHYFDEPQGIRWDNPRRAATEEAIELCPTVTFAFRDFDGEELTATTRIEEREWRFGTGYFKWLSLFRRPKVRRSLDLHFSGETGKRKGSWKGGTIGHSIDMLPSELPEGAFRRYCDEHQMTFIGRAPDRHPTGRRPERAPGAKRVEPDTGAQKE